MPRGTRHRRAAQLALAATGAISLATFVIAPAASATESHPVTQPTQAVFVQTNLGSGNSVLSYAEASNGLVHLVGSYPTGGDGGSEAGAVVDPLASQGSLTYDADRGLLFAVNAYSSTLTEFSVSGTTLHRLQVVGTHGGLPTSVSVVRNLVYVLDAGGDGEISGYTLDAGNHLSPIAGSVRSLGLGNPARPNFLKSPAQVAITPDRHEVVVATKTNGTLIVFPLDHAGVPTAPVVTPSAGGVPFGLSFDSLGRLLVAEASGGESSYWVQRDGELTNISAHVANGQAATCWSTVANGYLYDANAGSGTITGYSENWRGQLTLLNTNGVTATTDAGPVDITSNPDGQFLYQLATGAGAIDEFKVNTDGSLTKIGAVTGLPIDNGHGTEGIAAT